MATSRATVPAGNVAFVDANGILTTYGRNLLVQLLKNESLVISGAGVPTFAAVKGTIYINLNGSGPANRAYINTDGATGWTNFVTAA